MHFNVPLLEVLFKVESEFSVLVNDLELKRLKDAFKRSSTLSGYMMKNVFIREVFGDVVPTQLAEVSSIVLGQSAQQ